jgi:hypothetical protein
MKNGNQEVKKIEMIQKINNASVEPAYKFDQ